MDTLVEIRFTDADVDSIATDLGIDPDIARARATSWANAIRDTASQLINEQMASVIEHDTP